MTDKKSYSMIQMGNFYETLSSGLVKPSGIMNYIQHLSIAEKCQDFSEVLEVCCGRRLIIPLLNKYSKNIQKYIGLDISPDNLKEAQHERENRCLSPYLQCEFVQGNVTELSRIFPQKFNAIIYTSSIEHMEKEDGEKSIAEINKVLCKGGHLFLSTPRTKHHQNIQYKVHIYEWDYEEIKICLNQNDFEILEEVGLLPPNDFDCKELLDAKFGSGAGKWLEDLRKKVPEPFMATIIAASIPDFSKEILYICIKK
jgi:SAM-dependent methyltransferase